MFVSSAKVVIDACHASGYQGTVYNVLKHNCRTFCHKVCQILGCENEYLRASGDFPCTENQMKNVSIFAAVIAAIFVFKKLI